MIAIPYSILSDWATWKHLAYLAALCGITFIIVWFSESYKSLSNNIDVTARAQLLIELVLVAYITIVINRWDRVRNHTLHQMWAALEELSYLSFSIVLQSDIGSIEERIQLTDKMIRYCRLCIQLTFLAAQGTVTRR